jgi:hypothetical protein
LIVAYHRRETQEEIAERLRRVIAFDREIAAGHRTGFDDRELQEDADRVERAIQMALIASGTPLYLP